jgi:hypothetical protein
MPQNPLVLGVGEPKGFIPAAESALEGQENFSQPSRVYNLNGQENPTQPLSITLNGREGFSQRSRV